jgi:pimeloyl-ACP methyl ester carboxylesterase
VMPISPRRVAASLIALCALAACVGKDAQPPARATVRTVKGTIGAADYLIRSPSNWNGVLLVYSHGLLPPDTPNPPTDGNDDLTSAWLLNHGYALAGTNYGATGWAIKEALETQVQLVGTFTTQVGRPAEVIAWGRSMGGTITAALVEAYPQVFAGGFAMCGGPGGSLLGWDTQLDEGFAAKLLFPLPATFEVANVQTPYPPDYELRQLQQTATGRARIALVAALDRIPGWAAETSRPASTDFDAMELAQFGWLQDNLLLYGVLRQEVERRAGGNPSTNVGTDYRARLHASAWSAEVIKLYEAAGLSLDADLERLAKAPRIAANAQARLYLQRYVTFTGNLKVPLLTMHTVADGLAPADDELVYARQVLQAGTSAQLRQLYVQRAGHCAFTTGEILAAFRELLARVTTGSWRASVARMADLNRAATEFGSRYGSLFRLPLTPEEPQFGPPPA